MSDNAKVDTASTDQPVSVTEVETTSTNQPEPTTEEVEATPMNQPVQLEQNTESKENVSILPFIHSGERPFSKACNVYQTMLLSAIDVAIKDMFDKNHQWKQVHFPLFSTLSVATRDSDGKEFIKTYTLHELHYGPTRRFDKPEVKPEVMPYDVYKWEKFQRRNNRIWLSVNSVGKLPGGDGTGFGGTACSIFRDVQMNLLRQNLYLIDTSYIYFDESRKKMRYAIKIFIQRNPPPYPVKTWHGYGYIPGLGSVYP
jgi:hypothetical protein